MWILWDLYSIWSTLEKTWGLTRTNQCKTFTPLQPPWNPGISRPSPRTCVVLKRRRANWHAVHGTFFYQPAKGKGRQVWGKHTLDPPPGFATSIPNPTSPTSQIIFFCHWTSKLLVDHIPQLFVLTLKEAQAKVLIWFSDLRSQVAQIPCNKRIYTKGILPAWKWRVKSQVPAFWHSQPPMNFISRSWKKWTGSTQEHIASIELGAPTK